MYSNDAPGHPIIKEEVEKAITRLKKRKACEPDTILPEIRKKFKEGCLELLVALLNNIYRTRIIPNDWLRSSMKQNPTIYED